MLNYSQFKTALAEAIRNSFGYDYEVTEGVVAIANEGLLDIISIRHEGSRVAGTVYPKRCFEEYTSGRIRGVDEIASRSKEDYRISNPEESLQNHVDSLSSAENVVEKVFYRMIGIPGNEAYLKDVPYIIPEGFEDIALVPTIPVEMGRDFGTITVRKFQLQGWNISEADLHAAASANTEKLVTIRPLSDVLSEMIGDSFPMMENPFHVSSSDPRYDASPLGAPKVMESVFAELGEHFVIPSSVHEMLFLPKSFETDPERLKSFVREVNTEVLVPQDRLSDSIYECKGPGMYVTHRSEEFMGAGDSDKATNDFHL